MLRDLSLGANSVSFPDRESGSARSRFHFPDLDGVARVRFLMLARIGTMSIPLSCFCKDGSSKTPFDIATAKEAASQKKRLPCLGGLYRTRICDLHDVNVAL